MGHKFDEIPTETNGLMDDSNTTEWTSKISLFIEKLIEVKTDESNLLDEIHEFTEFIFKHLHEKNEDMLLKKKHDDIRLLFDIMWERESSTVSL